MSVGVIVTSTWTGVAIVVGRWSVKLDVVIGTSADVVMLGSCKHLWPPSVSLQLSMCPQRWAPDEHSSTSAQSEEKYDQIWTTSYTPATDMIHYCNAIHQLTLHLLRGSNSWNFIGIIFTATATIAYYGRAIHQLSLHFLRSHRYRNRSKLNHQALLLQSTQLE